MTATLIILRAWIKVHLQHLWRTYLQPRFQVAARWSKAKLRSSWSWLKAKLRVIGRRAWHQIRRFPVRVWQFLVKHYRTIAAVLLFPLGAYFLLMAGISAFKAITYNEYSISIYYNYTRGQEVAKTLAYLIFLGFTVVAVDQLLKKPART